MKFNPEEDDYIRENCLKIPIRRISNHLGRSHSSVRQRLKLLGLVIPQNVIEKFKADSYIKKGSIPINKGKKQTEYMSVEAIERTAKTRFKKGSEPHNTKYDGAERITRDGYVEVRISKGVYKLKHRVEWEKLNEPIGNDILVCRSNDKTNCSPDNWEKITRKEHSKRNANHENPTDKRIAAYLATTSKKCDKVLRNEILVYPEIITAKRTQIFLNRKIKQHGTKQNIRPK